MQTIVRKAANVSEESTELSDMPQVLQALLQQRGVTSMADIDYSLSMLPPPTGMLGLSEAVARLTKAITLDESIIVVGDFDADGATSTALAVRVLRAFGAKNVDFCVPNRMTCGYGLTPKIVRAVKKINPDLLLTVDNGISSHEGVAAANEAGMDVIVTDHHLPGDTLPDACAIVNPNQPGDTFVSRCMAGVGVVFYLLIALRSHLARLGWFAARGMKAPNMANYLDLVALGTVADLVPLDHLNRLLVSAGLMRIRHRRACAGINALLSIAGEPLADVRAQDLGFQVGPRLNAAGRLDDMRIGIACLLTDDPARAMANAKQLDELNKQRKDMQADMAQQAMQSIDALNLSDTMPRGVCLYDDTWHQGIVGLVASRIKDQCHRPVVAFAKEDDTHLKGSARSVKGVHIRDVLSDIATKRPDVLSQFGGHAMAAGLKIKAADYEVFADLFAAAVSERLAEEDCCGVIESDGELTDDDLTLEFFDQIKSLGPWGQAFPEPVFDGEFYVVASRWVGEKHLKMTIRQGDSSQVVEAIWFSADWPQDKPILASEPFKMAYRVDENAYNNMKTLQLIVVAMYLA